MIELSSKKANRAAELTTTTPNRRRRVCEAVSGLAACQDANLGVGSMTVVLDLPAAAPDAVGAAFPQAPVDTFTSYPDPQSEQAE